MKKLLSLVLALVMMASVAVYLPLGVTASQTSTQETIYAQDFDQVPDGAYTAQQLADLLGWELLRGGNGAELSVTDGALTLKSGDQDLLFKIATDMRMTGNCTVQFDLEQLSYTGGKTLFSNISIGSYDVTTGKTTAVMPKCNNEGYHHMALADNNVIDEKDHTAFKIIAAGHVQARSESILWGGGYSQPKSMTTWKNVYDVENNQVDSYSSGARINSTAGCAEYEGVNLSAYMGKDAFLRVQTGRTSKFDNISIVTGAQAILANGNVVYEQNFDNISFDPETQSYAELAAMIGWKNLDVVQGIDLDAAIQKINEEKANADAEAAGQEPPYTEEVIVEEVYTTYSIVDGMLDIFNPYNGKPSDNSGNKAVESQIYIPEMELAENRVVIEYDQMYVYESGQLADEQPEEGDPVYKDVKGEQNAGDQELSFTMYGRRNDFYATWLYTQKGFNKLGFKNGEKKVNNATTKVEMGVSQLRPQNVAYQKLTSGYTYTNRWSSGWTKESHYNLYDSLDHIKVVLDLDTGIEIYTNGSLTWFLSDAQLAQWLSSECDGGAAHIIGNLLKISVKSGCHVRLDNLKVTVDPEEVRSDLLITEAAVNAFGKEPFEYVEVYNNSDKAVNIYDYSLVTMSITDSYRKQRNATNPADVLTIYQGKHTYESVAEDKSTGKSLYSVTLENPAYADGWLQPGQAAVIWNTADAMHSGTYDKPTENKTEWSYTVEDFRKATFVPENVKVFQSYNNYNRSFDSEGRYLIALAEQSVFQAQYVPEFEWGNRGVSAEIPCSYENYVSYVYMLPSGPFDPYDNLTQSDTMTKNEDGVNAYPSNSGLCYRDFMSGALNLDTGAPATYLGVQFGYGPENGRKEGLISIDPDLETRYDVSPGLIYNRQKRTVQYTIDGVTSTKYLGTTVYYEVCTPTDGKHTLFSFVNGGVTYNTQPMSMMLVEDTTIERVGANIFTLKGAALKDTSTLVWTTAIRRNDFLNSVGGVYQDCLMAYYNANGQNMIQDIEIGTLVAKTADLTNGVELTVENVNAGNDGAVKKVGSRNIQWFANLSTYTAGGDQYYLLKAEYEAEDLNAKYSAVGYISITLVNGDVLTVYGDYSEAAHSRSVNDLSGN